MKKDKKVEKVQEPINEEYTPVQSDNKNKNRKKILITEGILVLIIIVVVTFLIINHIQKTKDTDKETEDYKESEPYKTPLEIDMKVNNISASKDYEIKLVREYNDNQDEKDYPYIYSFYNKISNQRIGGLKLRNSFVDPKCITDLKASGCIGKETKIYAFNVNNTDYIYITSGKKSKYYVIYDANNETKIKDGYATVDEFEIINGEIIIKYNLNRKKDFCGYEGLESLTCYESNGYIFSKGGNFEIVTGEVSFKSGEKYVILNYSKETNPNSFKTNLYNEKGFIVDTIENGIAYNEKYVLTYNGSEFAVYDYNNNKIGVIDSLIYDNNKYIYDLALTEEDGELVIRSYIKGTDESTQNTYFKLP